MFKKQDRQQFLKIQLSLWVIYTLISLPVSSQETQKAPAKFLLSVSKQELPQLSGDGTEPGVFLKTANKPAITNPVINDHSLGTGNPKQVPDSENYQISWSTWIAELASRWLLNLRNAESFYGLQFETLKPALFQFTCYADGHIDNVILKQSSGILLYDKLQMATLLRAAPLPPFPQGTRRTNLTLVQGWESHLKQPGEQEFEPWNFANKFPQEKVSVP